MPPTRQAPASNDVASHGRDGHERVRLAAAPRGLDVAASVRHPYLLGLSGFRVRARLS